MKLASPTLQKFRDRFKDRYSENKWKLVEAAAKLAFEAHSGQFRKSGQPYFEHALEVGTNLAQMELDAETIAAGLLHDVVEDTEFRKKQIKKEFGSEVASLVEGVTKLDKIRIERKFPFFKAKKQRLEELERQFETFRKMFLAMSRDVRVILVKMADRLHNMQTLEAIPSPKREQLAHETLEIYAPIAHRLGMSGLQAYLEDLAFFHLYPREYQWVKKLAIPEISQREKYLQRVKKVLNKELTEAGVHHQIYIRAKHWYSIYRKLLRKDKDISRIYDLVALRVVVKKVEDCYNVLGIIHKLWKPLIGEIKDYIALPKPNGYQSIHTTVFALRGKITEIQIRTGEMHYQARFGVAAHWHYAEGQHSRRIPKDKIVWLKELARFQKRISDPNSLDEALKLDFFKDRIFIFTPKGDVKDLPLGATPVDFAYSVHTDIGNHCTGALINGKITKLDVPLKNGDVVKIITNKKAFPKQDWLQFIKTQLARSQIRKTVKIKNG